MPDYSRLVKAYDIRGEVPAHLNPTLAEKLGTLFIRLTNANRIVIARDMRSTSPALANAF
ncbi:MAG: phosphomannomutase/phosphoglucomutase, partial [Streptomyces oryziradicis]|nr:phosphomannomutase/phosphoglucomutase [Actinacidiphila oryziradicis]